MRHKNVIFARYAVASYLHHLAIVNRTHGGTLHSRHNGHISLVLLHAATHNGQVQVRRRARERSTLRITLCQATQGIDGGIQSLLVFHLLTQSLLLARGELLHRLLGRAHIALQLLALCLRLATHRIERVTSLRELLLLLVERCGQRVDTMQTLRTQHGHGAYVGYAACHIRKAL